MVAQQLTRALQDSATRIALQRALRDPDNRGNVDLTDCRGRSVAARLAKLGELRGGMRAAEFCAAVRRSPQMILHMDRRQLSGWDGSTAPIVTAMVNPSGATPGHLMGYRSPEVLIDIGADKKLAAPILVVLPLPHPRTVRSRRGGSLPTVAVRTGAPPSPTNGGTKRQGGR